LAQLLVHWHLARELEPSSYGAFSLASLVALLAVSLHHGFLVEPLLVASASSLGRSPGYLRAIVRLHWFIALPAGLLLTLAGWLVAGHAGFRLELAATGALLLGLSSVRLLRGMAYARLSAGVGTAVVVGYAALTAGGMLVLAQEGATSSTGALLVMGLAGAVAAGGCLLVQKLAPTSAGQTAEAWRYHVEHGRWLLLLSPLRWAVDALPLMILGLDGRLAAVGLLRAALNLVAPFVQLVGALRLMLLPRFAEAATQGQGPLAALLRKTQWLTLGMGATLLTLLVSQGELLLRVYGGRHQAAVGLLPLVALTPALLGSALLFGNVLRVRGRSDLSLRAFAAATVVSGFSAWYLTPRYSAAGAALALACGYLTLLIAKGWLVRATAGAAPRG